MAGRFDTATIKEQVYQILRQELVRQRYKPGEWLQENEIAERLNVSRSPVREALRMLTGDGLLVEIPKKGVYVRKLTEDKIRENFSICCLLEVNAIQSLHDLQTEAAEALLACLSRECTAYPDRDPWEKQAEESLHALLMWLAGNETAVQIHKKLCDQLLLIRVSALSCQSDAERSSSEHAKIVEYILEGCLERAADLDRAHPLRTQELVLQYVSRK